MPPLLTAYMSSKFAVEAFVRSFRVEMQLTERPIDVVMISPGFVKPTMLVETGIKLNKAMWNECQKRYCRLGRGWCRHLDDDWGTEYVCVCVRCSVRRRPCSKGVWSIA